MKLFHEIKAPNDCVLLQKDLDNLTLWCRMNNLSLNLSKCQVITFSKRHNTTLFTYHLSGTVLTRVYKVKDLGVILESDLSFNAHYEMILSRANKMLGFLKRSCREFDNILTLIHLFCTLVRPLLEYCCVVWSPFYSTHINRIESVQNKFIKFILFKLGLNPRNYSYPERLELVGLRSLADRRRQYSVLFGFRLLRGFIDCSDLLQHLRLNTPSHTTRSFECLNISFHRTNYGKNSPLTVVARDLNSLSQVLDIFDCSLGSLRRALWRVEW